MKVVGLQRSGTNYLEQLLRANFHDAVHIDPMTPFFKHSLPDQEQVLLNDGTKVYQLRPSDYIGNIIVISKERDKWIESIQRNPADLENKRPELFDNGKLLIPKAKAFWRRFHEAWEEEGVYIVEYRDLLYDLDWELDKISQFFYLSPRYETYVNLDKVPNSGKFTREMRNAYLK